MLGILKKAGTDQILIRPRDCTFFPPNISTDFASVIDFPPETDFAHGSVS